MSLLSLYARRFTVSFRGTRLPSYIAARSAVAAVSARSMTDSITYSGGQATEGQGGFYGSGGARATGEAHPVTADERSKMLALAADVQKIQATMKELEVLENLLMAEKSEVSAKSIELKNSIKKLMTSHDVLESLNRLEIQGEPVWGLSSEEREMIMMAREKVNEC